MRSSPPADRAEPTARALLWPASLALTAFLLAWALLHASWLHEGELVDTPTYEGYGDAIVARRGARTGTSCPSTRRSRCPPSSCRRSSSARTRRTSGTRSPSTWPCSLCGAVLVGLVWWTLVRARRLRRAASYLPLALVAVAPLLLGSVVLSRFDLWPAAARLGGARGRSSPGATGSAPGSSAPPSRRSSTRPCSCRSRPSGSGGGAAGARRSSPAAVFAAVLVVCVGPFLLLAPDGLASSVWRQLDRPLQLESLPAAAARARRRRRRWSRSHGSQNLAGSAGVALGVVMTVAAAAVLVWLWVRFARGPTEPARLVRYAAACGGRVRRAREGALAAVPALARPARPARARAPRARRLGAARRGARAHAGLVPVAVLGLRADFDGRRRRARGRARPRARRAPRRARQPASRASLKVSQLVARPVAGSHSSSTPSMRTSPVAGSKRTGIPVRRRWRISSVRRRSPSRAGRSCRRR